MNGVELAEHVRSKRPDVPIVFSVTGDDGQWAAEERWILNKTCS